MTKPDSKNAHVRRNTRQTDPGLAAEDANRLLNDPAFVKGFERLRENIVSALESKDAYDGSEESKNFLVEQCRQLVVLKNLKHMISATLQGQQLREAGYKPSKNGKE